MKRMINDIIKTLMVVIMKDNMSPLTRMITMIKMEREKNPNMTRDDGVNFLDDNFNIDNSDFDYNEALYLIELEWNNTKLDECFEKIRQHLIDNKSFIKHEDILICSKEVYSLHECRIEALAQEVPNCDGNISYGEIKRILNNDGIYNINDLNDKELEELVGVVKFE